mgnify:CR=1 FL=1
METQIKDSDNELENGKVEAEVISPEDKARMPALEEMMKVGLIYGRKKSKTSPKMKAVIYTYRNGVALFDLTKTLEQFEAATAFLKGVTAKGGRILIIGTQPAARDLVKTFAEDLKQLYVNERWLGGMLTNYKTIGARIEHFKKLKEDKAAGRHEKYTKKEQLMLTRETEKLNMFFGGVEQMVKLPDAVLIIDTTIHETALREARKMKIPVVALMNSDGDPAMATYPITANSNARPGIIWVLAKFKNELGSVKIEAPVVK